MKFKEITNFIKPNRNCFIRMNFHNPIWLISSNVYKVLRVVKNCGVLLLNIKNIKLH